MALLLLLLGVAPLRADERSTELLRRLQQQVERLAGYHIRFTVQVEGREIAGDCQVRGESCYLRLGEAELYADATTRYEVDPTKREVVIDSIDPTSHNLLQNPTRAFLSLAEDFQHETRSEAAGFATLRLTPASRSVGVSTLELILDTKSALPCSLRYDADGEQLLIVISTFEPSNSPLQRFDAASYPDYELIDFR